MHASSLYYEVMCSSNRCHEAGLQGGEHYFLENMAMFGFSSSMYGFSCARRIWSHRSLQLELCGSMHNHFWECKAQLCLRKQALLRFWL